MSNKQYNEEELQCIETLLCSNEKDVWAGLTLIGPGLLPERLTIALYNIIRFYDDAGVVGAAYDRLATQAAEPLRSLIGQYHILRQPDEGGDETTRKTLYQYIEEEANFNSKIYLNAVIRVMRFFCQRALNTLHEMMDDVDGAALEEVTFDDDLDFDWDELDLELDFGPFTITDETGYLNDSHRHEAYSALDFIDHKINHLQVYPCSVLMDVEIQSEQLAGIQKLTLIEADRPLMLPDDLGKAPHLDTLAFHYIDDFSPQTWSVLQQAKNIQCIEVELTDDMTHPPADLFELQQVTTLHLNGTALELDFPVVLLGGLRHLHIEGSTLEGAEQLFRQLDTLHALETTTFHPELEAAYRQYKYQQELQQLRRA